jgi:hypothetical protein
MTRLVSLNTVRISDWLVKASVFDDQILIISINSNTMDICCKMFYDEEHAHNFVESFLRG